MNIKNLLLTLSCLAAMPVWAASTCQQRVDENLDKTTSEKVTLCLTEPKETVPEENAARVIYSNIETTVPKKKNVWMQEQKHKPYKKQGPVNSEYVERNTFPSFVNDTLSSADLVEANDRAKEIISSGKEAAARSSVKPARKLNLSQKTTVKQPNSQTVQPAVPAAQLQEAQALEADPLADSQDSFTSDDLLTEESFGYNATDPALQP